MTSGSIRICRGRGCTNLGKQIRTAWEHLIHSKPSPPETPVAYHRPLTSVRKLECAPTNRVASPKCGPIMRGGEKEPLDLSGLPPILNHIESRQILIAELVTKYQLTKIAEFGDNANQNRRK